MKYFIASFGIYLLILVSAIAIYLAFKFKKIVLNVIACMMLLITLVFFYGSYIEVNQLVVQETSLKVGFKGRIVLIADTHVGIWKNEKWIEKVVDKINSLENIEFVALAGDLTYEPKTENLNTLFSPLKKLKYPIYYTLGNHDVEMPGPKLRDSLVEAMNNNGAKYLFNDGVKFDNYSVVGLGDNWKQEDDVETLNKYSEKDNVVVIAHSPDTTLKYTNNKADITLSGHTHCGQARIPFLYKLVIPVKGDFDKGYYYKNGHKGFITCGVGEVALPIRLFNPPTVDILNFVD